MGRGCPSSRTSREHNAVVVQKVQPLAGDCQFANIHLRPSPSVAEGLAFVPFFIAFAYARMAPLFSDFFIEVPVS